MSFTEFPKEELTEAFDAAVAAGKETAAIGYILLGADISHCIPDGKTQVDVSRIDDELGLRTPEGATKAAKRILEANMSINALKMQ